MLAHDIAAALPGLRREAEAMMVNLCDIERATTAWDEAEQESVTTWAVVHSNVPCAFVMQPVASRSLLTEESVTPTTPQVKIPVEYDDVQPDDRVTIVDVGVVWVTHVPLRSHQVQRRLECRWAR